MKVLVRRDDVKTVDADTVSEIPDSWLNTSWDFLSILDDNKIMVIYTYYEIVEVDIDEQLFKSN